NFETSSVIEIRSDEGLRYVIPQPFALESDCISSSDKAGSVFCKYVVKRLGNEYEFSVLTPSDWLLDESRKYPVTIDPTVDLNHSALSAMASNGNEISATECYVRGCSSAHGMYWVRGAVKWDISSIPNDATSIFVHVTFICVRVEVSERTYHITINDFEQDNVPAPYRMYWASVYPDLGNGEYYAMEVDIEREYGSYYLGAAANEDLLANLDDQYDWFQIGLATGAYTSDGKWFGNSSEPNILTVDYEGGGPPTGILTTGTGSNNPLASEVSSNAQDVVMLQLNLAADDTEDITVSSITLKASGTGDDYTDVSGVRLINDLNGNGAVDTNEPQISVSQRYSADNGTSVFYMNETISLNTTENWLVVYNFAGTASQEETFICSLENSSAISASGVDSASVITSGGTFPVTGATKTISAPPSGELTISMGGANPGVSSVCNDAQGVPMLQINLTVGDTEDIRITSITFNSSGTGDDRADVSSVSLYNDLNSNGLLDTNEPQIGSAQTYSANDGAVTFSGLSEVINRSTSESWLVVYNFAGSAELGETFRCAFTGASNLNATGVTSNSSITPSGSFPISGGNKTISVIPTGYLTVSIGSNTPGDNNVARDAQHIYMLQISITVSNDEAVRVSSLTFRASGSGDDSIDISSARLLNDYNSNGMVDANEPWIGMNQVYATDNGTITISGISEVVNQNSTENWLVVYNFSGTADVGDTFCCTLESADNITATGMTSNSELTVSGTFPINGGTKTAVLGTTSSKSTKSRSGCSCSFEEYREEKPNDIIGYFFPVAILFGTVLVIRFRRNRKE
ncbi:MAG: hypothetical protein ABIH42_04340, partial [Planctomycetota bacterium]